MLNMSPDSNSGGTTVQILCGTCKSATKSVSDPQAEDQVTCTGCGKHDTFENVMGSVKEYIGHRAAQSISNSLRSATRGSKYVKFTSKAPQHRSFPWITSDMGI
jgi:hypothetical protein